MFKTGDIVRIKYKRRFDFETINISVIVEKLTRAKDSSEARRRLEVVLEDKALQRLINDDFYEQG